MTNDRPASSLELLQKHFSMENEPGAGSELFYRWLSDSLTSWFAGTAGAISFSPFAHYFVGHGDFDQQFHDFFSKQLSFEKFGGQPSEQAQFLIAANRLLASPQLYSDHTNEFRFLLSFLGTNDMSELIGQLTSLIKMEGFNSDKHSKRWLVADVIRSVLSSQICDERAETFYRAATKLLCKDNGASLIPQVMEQRLILASRNEDKLSILLESSELQIEYQTFLAINFGSSLGERMRDFGDRIQICLDDTFQKFVTEQPLSIQQCLKNEHLVLAGFFPEQLITQQKICSSPRPKTNFRQKFTAQNPPVMTLIKWLQETFSVGRLPQIRPPDGGG